ncbi:aspartate dehydrogenase [Pseudoduganella sp. LjRoot289]|uniref:aspartate dehydrogenase n=1 Tax=Pseudoduganella sp. LjRoot289 TaxID=3342314 RepID=UPI003ECC5C1E
MLRVAMIGCGAIGAGVLELLKHDAEVVFDLVIVHAAAVDSARARLGALYPRARVDVGLSGARPDLLIECAGHSAIEAHIIPALASGIPCMLVSAGVLAEAGLAEKLEQAARHGQTQVQLLPGAIGAIDALAAARVGGLDSVVYTCNKPPGAWKNTPAERLVDLDALAAAATIFEGSAREAARLYPKNANVAATLSFAGLGLDRTRVRLLADPGAAENMHHVVAQGAFGSFELTMRGKPLAANPKTSALTVFSVVRALHNRARTLCI